MPTDVYLNNILQSLPSKPGIYQFFDNVSKVIYIGKAKNLKNRVSSYFTNKHDSAKTRILVRNIRDIQYIVVKTEADALLLENSLIKKYRPKYNIQLKDDKTYPWICIKKEPFSRVFSTRRVISDGSKYYGPYPSVKVVNTLLELFNELFPIRTCNLDLVDDKINSKKFKICLEYHIGNCKGPCEGFESKEDYQSYLNQIDHILRGNLGLVKKELTNRMNVAAINFQYEEAQNWKSKIQILGKYQSKSEVVSSRIKQVDVITCLKVNSKKSFVNYLMICNGAIVHGQTIELETLLDETKEQIIEFALNQMRSRFGSQSKEVIVEEHMQGLESSGLKLIVPKKGDKLSLLDLSKRNLTFFSLDRQKRIELKAEQKRPTRILEQLQLDFKLKDIPVYMECFDNSNIQGTNPVSACVVFKNGKPSKKDYRHYNIKTVIGPDDFASMREVVYRRYKRLLDEMSDLPQLVVIDGGKGQLSAAVEVLQKLGLYGQIAIIGIAKKLEEIYFPNDSIPLYLDKKSESLKLIQFMRNEAHRFGIEHHRTKRSKNAFDSDLENISGIGTKSIEKLMRHFKTINGIRIAKLNELEKVVGKVKAVEISNYFQKEKLLDN